MKKKTPEFKGSTEQLVNALRHMETRNNLTLTDKSVVMAAAEEIESMLHQIIEIGEMYD